MPTYEYECKKCGKRFERYQAMSAKPLSKCPYCKGRVRRLISAGGGVIFKGSGFYETDYKRKNEPPAKRDSDSGPAKKKDPVKKSDTGKNDGKNDGKSDRKKD